jgi:hypothetical protein
MPLTNQINCRPLFNNNMIKKGIYILCLLILGLSDVSARESQPFFKEIPVDDFVGYAEELYKAIDDNDLNYEAFTTALKGYVKLQSEGQIEEGAYLTVIDMSLSANKNRFFLIDLKNKKIIHKSIVAHGKNSGGEYAKYFSNKVGSYKSSIGFYRTAETYNGKHGLSLRLDGLEYCNNNARKRAIVIHSAAYVSENFIKNNGRLGRSLGCPSLPQKDYDQVVNKIKNGSLLFIYYPEDYYLKNSVLANFTTFQFNKKSSE